MTGIAARPAEVVEPAQPAALSPVGSKVDALADRLFTAIAVGEYLPGTALPNERELAADLAVSRSTVREALGRLVAAGLVETRRGRGGGSFVRSASAPGVAKAVRRSLEQRWDEIVDAIEAVSRLQEAIVRAAAENRTDADIAALQARLVDFRDAETGRGRQQADAALHLTICAAAHNQTLTDILIDLERRISVVGPGHLWGAQEDHAAMEARALADHTELVRLIAAGDAERGGELARVHAHIDLDLLESARRRAIAQAEAEQAQANSTP